MLQNRRGIALLLGLVAVLTATVAIGGRLLHPQLPDPAVASRQQLLQWLALRDLSQESEQTRQSLAVRLDEEYGDFQNIGGALTSLDPSRKRLVIANLKLLLGPWFLRQVDAFGRTAADRQSAFVDAFLDRLERWKKVAASAPLGDLDGNRPDTVAIFMAEVHACRDQADPRQRAAIDAFAAAAEKRWLWRQVRGFWGK